MGLKKTSSLLGKPVDLESLTQKSEVIQSGPTSLVQRRGTNIRPSDHQTIGPSQRQATDLFISFIRPDTKLSGTTLWNIFFSLKKNLNSSNKYDQKLAGSTSLTVVNVKM